MYDCPDSASTLEGGLGEAGNEETPASTSSLKSETPKSLTALYLNL